MRPAEKEGQANRLIDTPAVLIFAASERAPAYESQMLVLEERADDLDARGILVGCLFAEGESRLGAERIDQAEARQIRSAFCDPDEDFQIVLVDASGNRLRDSDAPLQAEAILNALDEVSD